MNGEQLKKINELVEEVKHIDDIFKCEFRLRYILICKQDVPHEREMSIGIPTEIIDNALTAYRDKLKAELKELGYEE